MRIMIFSRFYKLGFISCSTRWLPNFTCCWELVWREREVWEKNRGKILASSFSYPLPLFPTMLNVGESLNYGLSYRHKYVILLHVGILIIKTETEASFICWMLSNEECHCNGFIFSAHSERNEPRGAPSYFVTLFFLFWVGTLKEI